MGLMLLDKRYDEAAEGLMGLIQNGVQTERVTMIGDQEMREIVVEGDFQVFPLHMMQTWGGHLRFTIRDTEAKDEEAVEMRGTVAMYAPELAQLMTARAQMQVEKRQHVTIRTIKLINEREIDRKEEEQDEWLDVTDQFHKIASSDHLMTR